MITGGLGFGVGGGGAITIGAGAGFYTTSFSSGCGYSSTSS